MQPGRTAFTDGFWSSLSRLKLVEWRLDDGPVPCTAVWSLPGAPAPVPWAVAGDASAPPKAKDGKKRERDRHSSSTAGNSQSGAVKQAEYPILHFSSHSFPALCSSHPGGQHMPPHADLPKRDAGPHQLVQPAEPPLPGVPVWGYVRCFNTVQAFHDCARTAQGRGQAVGEALALTAGRPPWPGHPCTCPTTPCLCAPSFLLLVFADLKEGRYVHMACLLSSCLPGMLLSQHPLLDVRLEGRQSPLAPYPQATKEKVVAAQDIATLITGLHRLLPPSTSGSVGPSCLSLPALAWLVPCPSHAVQACIERRTGRPVHVLLLSCGEKAALLSVPQALAWERWQCSVGHTAAAAGAVLSAWLQGKRGGRTSTRHATPTLLRTATTRPLATALLVMLDCALPPSIPAPEAPARLLLSPLARSTLTTLAIALGITRARVVLLRPGRDAIRDAAVRQGGVLPTREHWLSSLLSSSRTLDAGSMLATLTLTVPEAGRQAYSRQVWHMADDSDSDSSLPCLSWSGWEPREDGTPGPRISQPAGSLRAMAQAGRQEGDGRGREETLWSEEQKQVAIQGVESHLHLMRWRQMPSLDPAPAASCRVLLLGAGTLGCYMARTLLAYGFRALTFVDSGKVTYVNPARQPLFEWSDVGAWKAHAAARAVRRIHPGAQVQGIVLAIPMPGHAVDSAGGLQASIGDLCELYCTHDVVMLLTDTRESRWLPTLLSSAWGMSHRLAGREGAPTRPPPLAISVALGFDSWVVTRHGSSIGGPAGGEEGRERLACYFCSDVVAPADSVSGRALDQQCSVTRPGAAPAAAGCATELLMTLLQHPQGLHAPAEGAPAVPLSSHTLCPLGLAAHTVRCFMTHYVQKIQTSKAFDRCTACSPGVSTAFSRPEAAGGGLSFLARACADSSGAFLEGVAGLGKEWIQYTPPGAQQEAGDRTADGDAAVPVATRILPSTTLEPHLPAATGVADEEAGGWDTLAAWPAARSTLGERRAGTPLTSAGQPTVETERESSDRSQLPPAHAHTHAGPLLASALTAQDSAGGGSAAIRRVYSAPSLRGGTIVEAVRVFSPRGAMV